MSVFSSRAALLLAFALLAGRAGAELDDRITDQVRLSLSTPEWATMSYEHHFHHGGIYYRDPMVQVEAGWAGGKLSLGSGFLESPDPGRYCEGDAVKLSVLRTWNDPVFVESEQTYLGVEVERFFGFLGHAVLRVGAYYRVSGNKDDHDVLFTAGIGFPIFSYPRGPTYFD